MSSAGSLSPVEEAGLRREADSENGELNESFDYANAVYTDYQDSDVDSNDEDYREGLLKQFTSLPIEECEFIDDEEYLKELGIKEAIDTTEAGMNKIARAHLMGALMADGVKMKDGITAQDINVNFNTVTNFTLNLQGIAELVADEEELMKCRENAQNVLLLDRFKDMVTFDIATNTFKTTLQSEVMKQLAEDVYRTAKANKIRKEKDEDNKNNAMETPENRKRYMLACDLLVQMMLIYYNEKCKNPEEHKISWDDIRELYKSMFDEATSIEGLRKLYADYNDLLELEKLGDKLNKASIKALFGRSSVKSFLSSPIYSKIKIDHDKQMMLSLDPEDIKNVTLIYSAEDYCKVEEAIEKDKTRERPRFSQITKEDRTKMEFEERKKTFTQIPMPTVHIPKVDKAPSKNVFGFKTLPAKAKIDYVPPGEAQEAPPSSSRDQNRFGFAEKQESDSESEDSASEMSSDAERPQDGGPNFTEDENDDKEEDRKKKNEESRRKDEKRRQAVEQKKKDAETSSQGSSIIVPTAPDRLGISAPVETGEEKRNSDAVTPPSENERITQFAELGDPQPIFDDQSDDEMFKPKIIEATQPMYGRPQMPNEQHILHKIEKGKEKEALLAKKEKERQEELRQREEERARQAEEDGRQREEEEGRRRFKESQRKNNFGRNKNSSPINGFGDQAHTFKDHPGFGGNTTTKGFGHTSEPERAPEPSRATPGMFATNKVNQHNQGPSQQPHASAFHAPPPSHRQSSPVHDVFGNVHIRRESRPENVPPQYPFGAPPSYVGFRIQQQAPYQPPQEEYRHGHEEYRGPQEPFFHQQQEQHYRDDCNSYRDEGHGYQSNHSQGNAGSHYERPMSPPQPQLGSTTNTAYANRRSTGCQTDPDTLLEELLGSMGGANSQNPNEMTPREQFLNFIKWHVFVYQDTAQAGKRYWSEMQKDLPQPLNDPEKLLGLNWPEVIEREVPQIEVNNLRRKGICFEWGG